MTDPAAIPMKPGYYWAKLRVPADGTHEAELWGFNDTWEIVQVNDNSADWEDNPAEPEALSVSVPGIRETQWRDGFVWGPFVAPLGRDMHSDQKRADAAMREVWATWFTFYTNHFRAPGLTLSAADQRAFYEIAQPIMRRLTTGASDA